MFCRDMALWLVACVIEGSSSKKSTPYAFQVETRELWSRYFWNLFESLTFNSIHLAVPNQSFVLYALFNFDYVCLFGLFVFTARQVPPSISPKRNLAPSS